MSHTVSELIEKFIALRDMRAERKRAFDEADKQILKVQAAIEGRLLAVAAAEDVDSFRVKGVGSAYVGLDMKASCKDWGSLDKWVLSTGNTSIYERRVSRTFLKDYMQESGGQLPPGIETITERIITVRKPTKGE